MMNFTIESLAALDVWVTDWAKQLLPGAVVFLDGPLGAGKTTLVQALAKAFQVSEAVVSPTFGLMHEYHSGRLPLIHVDFYRLGEEKADQLKAPCVEWIETKEAILLAEWACFAHFLEPYWTHRITLTPLPSGVREVLLEVRSRSDED